MANYGIFMNVFVSPECVGHVVNGEADDRRAAGPSQRHTEEPHGLGHADGFRHAGPAVPGEQVRGESRRIRMRTLPKCIAKYTHVVTPPLTFLFVFPLRQLQELHHGNSVWEPAPGPAGRSSPWHLSAGVQLPQHQATRASARHAGTIVPPALQHILLETTLALCPALHSPGLFQLELLLSVV